MKRRVAIAIAVAVLLGAAPLIAVADVTTGSTVTIPGFSVELTHDQPAGIEINPNTNLDGIQIRVADGIGESGTGPTHAYVFDSGGSLLNTQPTGELADDDTVLIEMDFSAGSAYSVALGREDGASYDLAEADDADFPFSSTDIDVSGAYTAGSLSEFSAYNIDQVTALTEVDRALVHIYNETAPSEYVDYPVEATVQFEGEDGRVFVRTTANGKVSMGGLPDQAYAVTVETDGPSGSPDYLTRSVYVDDPTVDHDVFLLNEVENDVLIAFSLDDNTGNFSPPDETTLYVETPLTVGGSTQYRTVTSRQFGASGEAPMSLLNDQNYRLRLEGPTNATRVLGGYRTAGADAPTLVVGQVSFEGATGSTPSFHATVTEVQGVRSLRISYYDPANATTALTLEAVNRSDATDVIRPQTTESGPFGRYSEVIPLSSSADSVAINVSYDAQRDGFEDESGVVFAGDLPDIATNLGVDPEVLSAIGLLTILGVLSLLSISRPRYAGIPTVVVAVGLVGFGVVAIHPLLLGGAGVIALLFAVGGEH